MARKLMVDGAPPAGANEFKVEPAKADAEPGNEARLSEPYKFTGPVESEFPTAAESTTAQLPHEGGMQRIIDEIYVLDIYETWKRLERGLSVGEDGCTDYATLMRHLDKADAHTRKAHQLYIVARLAQERFEIEAQQLEAGLRNAASKVLQGEKTAGVRSKAITDADVLAQIQVIAPDEWNRLAIKRLEHRKTTEHLEQLVSVWASRARSLQAMVGKVR